MQEESAVEKPSPDPAVISAGLKAIRKRRLILWFVILIYIPAIWLVLEKTHSDRATGLAFAIWLVMLIVAAFWSALIKCPRCGNLYHINGPTLFYYRRCLHCGLRLNADRKTR